MNNIFSKNRFLIIGGAVFVLLIIIFALSLSLNKKSQVFNFINYPTPTPILIPSNRNVSSSTHEIKVRVPETNIKYSDNNRLLQIIQDKPSLSINQNQIKQNLLKMASTNHDGIVYQNNDFIITYIKGDDDFQVEILTVNYKIAQSEAVEYFRNQGLVDNSICNLPIGFYLSYSVTQALANQSITINSIPSFCK